MANYKGTFMNIGGVANSAGRYAQLKRNVLKRRRKQGRETFAEETTVILGR